MDEDQEQAQEASNSVADEAPAELPQENELRSRVPGIKNLKLLGSKVSEDPQSPTAESDGT